MQNSHHGHQHHGHQHHEHSHSHSVAVNQHEDHGTSPSTSLLSSGRVSKVAEDKLRYQKARSQLLCASFFCFTFMLVEAAGGFYVGSLAIMSDAAHLLADCAGFAIALVGLYVAQRPTTLKYTYGYQRAEIIGAVLSVLLLWLLTGIIVYQAVLRVLHPTEVNGKYMFIIASFGLAVNLIMGFVLMQSGHGHSHGGIPHSSDHGHSHSHGGHGHGDHDDHGDDGSDSIAVKSAFIHVIGDALQSFGVMIAAGLIWYKPEWKLADPICSFVFGLIVLATTPGILRQAFKILLNAAPSHVSKQVYSALLAVECIEDIHDLHLWPLDASGKLALTVHIITTDRVNGLRLAQKVAKNFGIRHTTIQVECAGCDDDNCNEIVNCANINTHRCVMQVDDEIKIPSKGTPKDLSDGNASIQGDNHYQRLQ